MNPPHTRPGEIIFPVPGCTFVVIPVRILRRKTITGARVWVDGRFGKPSIDHIDLIRARITDEILDSWNLSVLIVGHETSYDSRGPYHLGIKRGQLNIVRFTAIPSEDMEWQNSRRGFVFIHQ